jgi:hypothetical protein
MSKERYPARRVDQSHSGASPVSSHIIAQDLFDGEMVGKVQWPRLQRARVRAKVRWLARSLTHCCLPE